MARLVCQGLTPDWSLNVAIAPDGALDRLTAAINQRPKRAFGGLRTQKEFVGAVVGGQFEIWERSQRAVHAVGRIQPASGGTRIEMRFVFPPITKALILVFFALYLAAAGSFAIRAPDATRSILDGAIGAGGAVVLVILFTTAARQQRSELRAFVERVFGDVPRI